MRLPNIVPVYGVIGFKHIESGLYIDDVTGAQIVDNELYSECV